MDLWVKSAHIISVIAWMAALLYLPRLFVYHCDCEIGSPQSELFKIMERRLLNIIAIPAMISTWFFGLWTAILYDVWFELWFFFKFVCVVILTGTQMMLVKYSTDFSIDDNIRSKSFYRYINEVPAVLMIIMVIMVVVKPL